MFLYRFFQKFLLFRENKTGVRFIHEFTSRLGFSIGQKKNGEIKSDAGNVQFFGWQFLQDADSIGGAAF